MLLRIRRKSEQKSWQTSRFRASFWKLRNRNHLIVLRNGRCNTGNLILGGWLTNKWLFLNSSQFSQSFDILCLDIPLCNYCN